MTATATLAFRRRGSTRWVEIDPLTPISLATARPSSNGGAMTAATLHVIPEGPPLTTNRENYGWLLRQRRRAREAFDYARSLPRRIWDWAYSTFHLGAVKDVVTGVAGWFWDKATIVGRTIGLGGGVGLGLLSVTTELGRTILRETVGRALGWVGSAASWLWGGGKSMLRHLGGPGNWVADRMENVEVLAKRATYKALTFYAENIGPHFSLDSKIVQTGKVMGIWMVGLRLAALVTTSMITWPLYAGMAFYTLMTSPVRDLPGVSKVADWIAGQKPEGTKTELRAVDKELHDAVNAAAAATAAGHPVPTPPNREARRAEKRTAARAGR